MQISLVTPYGSSEFDIKPVNVEALLAAARKYEHEAEAGAAAKAIAGAGNVLNDGNGETLDELKWPGYEAETESENEPEKPPKHSRNDSLFGSGRKEAVGEPEAGTDEKKQERDYKGFLYIKCGDCGDVKGFCAKEELREYKCKCGARTELRNLRPMYAKCECGREFKYYTNLEDESFEYRCLECGTPIDMVLNKRGTAYVTMSKNRFGGGTNYYNYGHYNVRSGYGR